MKRDQSTHFQNVLLFVATAFCVAVSSGNAEAGWFDWLFPKDPISHLPPNRPEKDRKSPQNSARPAAPSTPARTGADYNPLLDPLNPISPIYIGNLVPEPERHGDGECGVEHNHGGHTPESHDAGAHDAGGYDSGHDSGGYDGGDCGGDVTMNMVHGAIPMVCVSGSEQRSFAPALSPHSILTNAMAAGRPVCTTLPSISPEAAKAAGVTGVVALALWGLTILQPEIGIPVAAALTLLPTLNQSTTTSIDGRTVDASQFDRLKGGVIEIDDRSVEVIVDPVARVVRIQTDGASCVSKNANVAVCASDRR